MYSAGGSLFLLNYLFLVRIWFSVFVGRNIEIKDPVIGLKSRPFLHETHVCNHMSGY